MRATKAEEQQPDDDSNHANHNHAGRNIGLQDDVPMEKTTSRCHHRPFRSPDLSLHMEDLLGHLRSDTTVSVPTKGCWAGLLPAA
jgi:hypothetical protein